MSTDYVKITILQQTLFLILMSLRALLLKIKTIFFREKEAVLRDKFVIRVKYFKL